MGSEITSELPSKLRFQDDLETERKKIKNGGAASSTMLQGAHQYSPLQGVCGC